MNLEKQEQWKGSDFWIDEIVKAGLKDKLHFFNDVIIEKIPPVIESNYGDPVLINVTLDGKKCDIYHSDKTDKHTLHRLYIYIKE